MKTELHRVCEKGEHNAIPALVEAGVDLNAKSNSGMTPLHYVCWKGHVNVIPVLVDAGADVNAKDNRGETALHYGWSNSPVNVIQTLVDLGCDLSGYIQIPSVQNALADNASRRAEARAALKDIAFEDFTEINEFLDFLFLPKV